MKLNEFIKHLQNKKKEHGDVDVCCDFIPLKEENVYYDPLYKVIEINS